MRSHTPDFVPQTEPVEHGRSGDQLILRQVFKDGVINHGNERIFTIKLVERCMIYDDASVRLVMSCVSLNTRSASYSAAYVKFLVGDPSVICFFLLHTVASVAEEALLA